MVATEEEDILWILDFVSQEETNSLERMLASIDVITQK